MKLLAGRFSDYLSEVNSLILQSALAMLAIAVSLSIDEPLSAHESADLFPYN